MIIRSNNRDAGAARGGLFSATCLPFHTAASIRHRFSRALVVLIGIALALRGPSMLFAEAPGAPPALILPDPPIPQAGASVTPQANNSQPPQDEAENKNLQRKAADGELHQEEHQHIFGFIPYYNTVKSADVSPLSPSQKFGLAFRRSIHPLTFVGAGLVAGIGQAEDSFPRYGQGAQGYGKRLGAQYADIFDSNMIGFAILPVILHQDPRYFRLGTGGFRKRALYSLSTAVRAKGDDGQWQPGYSKILGSLAAGGIANLYYPPPNRGAGLTFQRAAVVTAMRSVGDFFNEFMPDIEQRLSHRKSLPPAANIQP
jgi:hypothetical protein